MTNFNMCNQTNYIAQMTEDEKIVFLKVLVAIARSDDVLKQNERDLIEDLAAIFGIAKEHRADIIAPVSDDEIIKEAAKIKNRAAALQLIKEACLLANSDGDLSDSEIVLIGKIGQAMNVELEKIEQISQWIIDRIVWLEQGKIIFEQF